MKIKQVNEIALTKTEKCMLVKDWENNQDTDLDFTQSYINPCWVMQRKPLPIVAHIVGKPSAEQFMQVKEEGRVPVFHKEGSNNKERVVLAQAAAKAEIENVITEYHAVMHHLARRNRQN